MGSVMGSSPESIRFLLQQLQCRPHTLRWAPPRPVLIRRGLNNKLGVHFKTHPCGDSAETLTVVVHIKDNCHIIEGSGTLQVGDRITRIGSVDVRHLQEQDVVQVFSQLQEVTVLLQVSAISSSRGDPNSQIKRFLSINSGASSGGSATSSVDSGERPQVKRFQKSNSNDNPSPPSPSSPSPSPRSLSSPSPPVVKEAPRVLEVHQPHHSCRSQQREGGGGGGGGGVVDVPPPCARKLQHCIPRECSACSRPQGYLFHSPPHLSSISLLHPPQHTHSLPDRMDHGVGDIILPDDIVLCEAGDSPSSLPLVLNPLPNTPTPPFLCQSQQVEGQGRCVGVEACRSPGCSVQRVCLWHRFVYKYPQYVVWDPRTKAVELNKHDPTANFGFKYKVKKYDGPPMEMFALVTEVSAGGVAWSLLLAGDWIRSINGTPVTIPEEEFFSTDFSNVQSLRLVIQRPQRLMPRGVPKLRSLAASLGISVHIPLAIDNANTTPPCSPDSVSTYYTPRDVDRAGTDDAGARPRGQNVFDPLLDQYPRLAQSPGEHIPLSTMTRSPALARSPGTLDRFPLPQARVVVCGAHGSAADFVRGLLGNSCARGVDVDPEAPVQSFQLSLQLGVGGNGMGSDFETYVRLQRACLTTLVKELECGVGEGGGRLRCMNMELYMINDEEFFHHCCSWLLPSSSLLILTFHVNKLLNQPQVETKRLVSILHTLQACVQNTSNAATASSSSSSNSSAQILLYGVPTGCQHDVSAEEMQVMFYVTDSGSQLLQRHRLSVSVAIPTCLRSMAAARQAVFRACEDRFCQVPQYVVRVVDSLSGQCGVKMFGGEVNALVCRAVGGDCDPALLQCVLGCLMDSGCLLPCGSNNRLPSREAPGGTTPQDCLVPYHIVQALASFLGKSQLDHLSMDSRQKWFKLISTGCISRSELAELLASDSSPLTIEILEQLGIIYMLQAPSTRSDSGFTEDAHGEFVIPYFLQDVCGGREGETGEGFVLRFERAVPWQGYYKVLCNLSALPATEEVTVGGQGRAVVQHNGLRLTLTWRRESGADNLFVAVRRAQPGNSRGEKPVQQELERLFSFVVPPALTFRVQAVDRSSPSSHLPSRDAQAVGSNPHDRTAQRGAASCIGHPQEETLVKPVVEVEDYSNLSLGELKWSILNQAAQMLTIAVPTGHDWKSVAERAGKTMLEICAYEAINSREVPAMSFFREWILTGTVQQFLDILTSLDRPDVHDLILNYLRSKKEGS